MAGYAIRTLADIPSIDEGEVEWKPVQHYFGLTAFGANVYRARRVGSELIEAHDESAGGHEEIYVVLSGEVRFVVDGQEHRCPSGTLVAVRDPAIRRSAVAETSDAAVLAIGNVPSERFASTWDERHFAGIPTIDG